VVRVRGREDEEENGRRFLESPPPRTGRFVLVCICNFSLC
jgi:hypothetical protein